MPRKAPPKAQMLTAQMLQGLSNADLESLSIWFGRVEMDFKRGKSAPALHEFLGAVGSLLIWLHRRRYAGEPDPPSILWETSMVMDLDAGDLQGLLALLRGLLQRARREGRDGAASFVEHVMQPVAAEVSRRSP